MKKILFILGIFLGIIGVFAYNELKDYLNRDEYEEYAGTYELFYVSKEYKVDDYEYYRIILEANGDCVVEYKEKDKDKEVTINGTYEIGDGEIILTTTYSAVKTTKTYDFVKGIDYQIHAKDMEVGQHTITAKFKRVSEENITE